ncbi:18.1 kDa class I heat shock protein-like [Selaginella moellendorffii]|uniref:18.1 kDa class I heat shock protein-like n=1 Tax=Selaginella moellendorffii TaxID=88036 RepID=UPI000D1C25C1|nr:18.1 kDa class I heat shock protein-like [Selaginella moellendorffii]|eukprot:XP_024520010.1 18.1 kDa class I heat shock protein-like [Selaginella moellendorffii]
MPTLLQQLPFRVRSTIKRDEDASDAPPIGESMAENILKAMEKAMIEEEEEERYERYGKEKEQKFKLHVSWLETSESHIIAVELPGVEKSGIKLQKMGDQALQLSGEREDVLPLPKDDAKAKFRQKELRAATFSRVFKFSSKVKEIKATFTNGILTITVPKEQDTVTTIAIQ